ncbi:uncharacterized protein LOC116301395 [Actinia tenebrosa]|uniref:Uncharacterized protein LOC116301395 n=1 Tax=Actinia tenebrosa TaxID=6105 RepID=A0A6P8IID8_ACTTE|nr:uncharacterized protein LOC116301395 [Actinia tenebrosa]
MKGVFLVSVFLCLLVISTCMPAKWIEMTYKFDNTTLYWPGGNRFKHTLVFQGRQQLFYYTSYDISSSEHGGTHLDAPIHFAQGKWTTDEIPLNTLIGDAVVIDITSKTIGNPDSHLMVDDITNWEKKHGTIPDDVILLVLTGWGRYWPDAKQYLGTDGTNTSLLHFPGLHPDAAQWLVKNRKIKLFGLDTASVDYGQSKDFKSHQILLAQNIPALENLANLDKLPPKGATVYAAPQFITDGSGGPCRVFATINKPYASGALASTPIKPLALALLFMVYNIVS